MTTHTWGEACSALRNLTRRTSSGSALSASSKRMRTPSSFLSLGALWPVWGRNLCVSSFSEGATARKVAGPQAAPRPLPPQRGLSPELGCCVVRTELCAPNLTFLVCRMGTVPSGVSAQGPALTLGCDLGGALLLLSLHEAAPLASTGLCPPLVHVHKPSHP